MTHQQQTALENIVGKGEIVHDEQFLLFPQCFLLNQIHGPFVHVFDIITLFAAELEEHKIGITGKGLKSILGKKKGENDQQVALQTAFLTLSKTDPVSRVTFILLSVYALVCH